MRSCLCQRGVVWNSLVSARQRPATLDKIWSRSSCSSAARTFKEGDSVTLRYKKRDSHGDYFVACLSPGKDEHTHQGPISHNDVIGMAAGQLFRNSKGVSFRACEVRLADWVTRTARNVTPIYPGEASNIVHHLDIHPVADEDPPLEILEAGTGHGSLTLYLARAIYGFNAAWERDQSASPDSKPYRRAVVYSVERNASVASRARRIVEGFRNGIYAGNVEFHIGDVSSFVRDESAKRQEQGSSPRYLSRVVLDLQHEQTYLEDLACAMRDDAILAVFTPNINKLVDCLKTIKHHKLPFRIEDVFQLGANHSAGMKWLVEAFEEKGEHSRPNNFSGAVRDIGDSSHSLEDSKTILPYNNVVEDDLAVESQVARNVSASTNVASSPDEVNWRVTCRPHMGYTVTGGGFLGLFRRSSEQGPLLKPAHHTVTNSLPNETIIARSPSSE